MSVDKDWGKLVLENLYGNDTIHQFLFLDSKTFSENLLAKEYGDAIDFSICCVKHKAKQFLCQF